MESAKDTLKTEAKAFLREKAQKFLETTGLAGKVDIDSVIVSIMYLVPYTNTIREIQDNDLKSYGVLILDDETKLKLDPGAHITLDRLTETLTDHLSPEIIEILYGKLIELGIAKKALFLKDGNGDGRDPLVDPTFAEFESMDKDAIYIPVDVHNKIIHAFDE